MAMANEDQPWEQREPGFEPTGDTAFRQLRSRYDLLRHDYEELLDRLASVEQRLVDEQRLAAARESGQPGSVRTLSREFLLAPLARLRDDYLTIADELITVANSLNDLASRSMKGQRRGTSTGETPEPAATAAGLGAQQPQHESTNEPQRISMQVNGGDLGQLLDFQERLSEIPGVARVSISQVGPERAVLTVELAVPDPGPR